MPKWKTLLHPSRRDSITLPAGKARGTPQIGAGAKQGGCREAEKGVVMFWWNVNERSALGRQRRGCGSSSVGMAAGRTEQASQNPSSRGGGGGALSIPVWSNVSVTRNHIKITECYIFGKMTYFFSPAQKCPSPTKRTMVLRRELLNNVSRVNSETPQPAPFSAAGFSCPLGALAGSQLLRRRDWPGACARRAQAAGRQRRLCLVAAVRGCALPRQRRLCADSACSASAAGALVSTETARAGQVPRRAV